MLVLTTQVFAAKVLNFECPEDDIASSECAAEYALEVNADVVQIAKVSSHQATLLCASLDEAYDHFVYVPTSHLFIASKEDLEIIPIRSHKNEGKAGSSAEVGVGASWGDGKGVSVEGYARGEAHDKNGNYVEGEVRQKNDGKGEANIHAGRETDRRK